MWFSRITTHQNSATWPTLSASWPWAATSRTGHNLILYMVNLLWCKFLTITCFFLFLFFLILSKPNVVFVTSSMCFIISLFDYYYYYYTGCSFDGRLSFCQNACFANKRLSLSRRLCFWRTAYSQVWIQTATTTNYAAMLFHRGLTGSRPNQLACFLHNAPTDIAATCGPPVII